MFYHSHKKRKDSLETRAVLVEISILCETYQAAQNTGIKTWLSLKGISCLLLIFVLSMKSYEYCRLACLTGVFKNHVYLVLCIIESDSKVIRLYVLQPFHLRRASKLSKLNQSIYSQNHPGR